MDVTRLIEESRQSVAQAVNAAISMLYSKIGRRINSEILHNKRGSKQLTNLKWNYTCIEEASRDFI